MKQWKNRKIIIINNETEIWLQFNYTKIKKKKNFLQSLRFIRNRQTLVKLWGQMWKRRGSILGKTGGCVYCTVLQYFNDCQFIISADSTDANEEFPDGSDWTGSTTGLTAARSPTIYPGISYWTWSTSWHQGEYWITAVFTTEVPPFEYNYSNCS